MADNKISALAPAVALVGDELIPAVQAGGNVSLTPAQIAALASPVAIAVYAADKAALDLITDQSNNAIGLTIDTATLYLWDDAGEAWVEIGPLRGIAGTDGTDGDPGPAIELQLSETHVQWRVVGDEAWTDLVALADLEGDPGTNGNTILSGSVDPTDEGVDGDFYLNTATSTLFGPKVSGTWPAGVLLKGADGDDAVVPEQVSAGEIEAGTETDPRLWSPADVVAAIDEHAEAGGTIGGSTGATDNAILRADGTEGGTIQAGTNAPTYSDTGVLTVAPAAVTGSAALSSLEINQTWNTTGAPTAIKADVTDTASASAALLVDLRVGGNSKFKADKEGSVTGSGHVIFGSGYSAYDGGASKIVLGASRGAGGASLCSSGQLSWCDNNNARLGTVDLLLLRDDANTLAQRNTTNAQESRLYGSYSSATAYQRLTGKTLRQAITAASGATLVSTITVPKFSHLIGVTTRVTTALGTSNGTTGYQVGDGTDPDLWGAVTDTAQGTTSDRRDFTAVAALGPNESDRTITLTAVGGNFDGTGVIEVCAFYLAAEAD